MILLYLLIDQSLFNGPHHLRRYLLGLLLKSIVSLCRKACLIELRILLTIIDRNWTIFIAFSSFILLIFTSSWHNKARQSFTGSRSYWGQHHHSVSLQLPVNINNNLTWKAIKYYPKLLSSLYYRELNIATKRGQKEPKQFPSGLPHIWKSM